MRVRIGRRGRATGTDAVSVVTVLAGLRASASTGCLTVLHGPSGQTARLFLLDGAVYAASVEHYDFPVGRRLLAGGLLDEAQVAAIEATTPPVHPDFGRVAVARGWTGVEDIGRLHREFVLACAGAVLAATEVTCSFEPGIVSSDFCTLPIDVEALEATALLRAERRDAVWEAVAPGLDPGVCIVERRLDAAVVAGGAPELAAMLASLDGERTVDQSAAHCGFSRAEAVHLIGALIAQGQAVVSARAGGTSPCLDVPEAFGRLLPEPCIAAAADEARAPDAIVGDAAEDAVQDAVDDTAEAHVEAVGEDVDALLPDQPSCTVVPIDARELVDHERSHEADIQDRIDDLRRELRAAEERAEAIRDRLHLALAERDVHVH